MDIEIKILKGIPVEQIERFEDKVVYNTAVITREFTKSSNAYPYLTGNLMKHEVSAPIMGSSKEYGLMPGVEYAKRVWNYTNVNWSNPSTMPQWYYSVMNKNGVTILENAVSRAIKEIK